jgi:MerR family transcriptional regulator, light-induced transcriptional regulator
LARPDRAGDFAGLSTTIACECPRHVAEILTLLSQFEDAACSSRDPEDEKLRAYLQRVAGASRSLFEQALERLAVREGLVSRR